MFGWGDDWREQCRPLFGSRTWGRPNEQILSQYPGRARSAKIVDELIPIQHRDFSSRIPFGVALSPGDPLLPVNPNLVEAGPRWMGSDEHKRRILLGSRRCGSDLPSCTVNEAMLAPNQATER